MTPQVTIGGIHLVNSSGTPTPGGAATAAATTPFAIRRGWSLAAPEPQPIWQGGPPFRNGSGLVSRGYPNVTETIPISVAGSSHENAVARLQELKRAISTPLFTAPAVMSVLPTGSSTIMYAEVYSAWVREVTESESNFEAWEGWSDIDAELIITRSPYFGAGSLTTLINGATFTNVGTGANNDTQSLESLGALTGDLTKEGQPLNIKAVPSVFASRYFLATALSRDYYADATGGHTTTSTTMVTTNALATSTMTIATIRANAALKLRVLIRFKTTLTNPLKARVRGALSLDTVVFATGPTVPLLSDTTAQLVDLGAFQLDTLRLPVINGTSTLSVGLEFASSDGTSVTVTVDYFELLWYYDFCAIDYPAGSYPTWLLQAQNLSGGGWLPLVPARAINYTSTDQITRIAPIRGTPPRAFTGASLYLAFLNSSTGAHDKTATATVTVNHAPLYLTLRGSG